MKVSAAVSVLRTEKGRPEVPDQPGLSSRVFVMHRPWVPLQHCLKKDDLRMIGWELASEMDWIQNWA